MRKITIVIASIIIAVAIIVPLGFFDLFDHSHIIKADSVNSSKNYMLSANFTAHSSTSPYYNPNHIQFNTTTYVDKGTANQSTLSLNGLVLEARSNCFDLLLGNTTLSGNFSGNILPNSMDFTVGVKNYSSADNNFNLGGQICLFAMYNTTIDSRLAIDGSLHESKYDNFTSNIPVSLENIGNVSHNASDRYHFSLWLGIFIQISRPTGLPKPFNFFVNASLPGYTVPVYNSVDTRIVDNATRGVDP